jgi:hypothetical protein
MDMPAKVQRLVVDVSRACRVAAMAVTIAMAGVGSSAAQTIPLPAPDPGAPDQNVFYGATPPIGVNGPVLVFVHGLKGRASDWWEGNDMYQLPYNWGYRSAYISLNADNTPNDAGLGANAAVLKALLPKIAQRFGVSQMYLVGHSKGGLDIQAALLDATIFPLARAVITISTPNQGTELADWAFQNPAVSGPMGLLTPGVFAMKTNNMAAFRAAADPILKAMGIPFFTIAGTKFTGNPLTAVTGGILATLAPGQANDGFVTVPRSRLSADYAIDLGTIATHHFQTDSGGVVFARLNGRIDGLERTYKEFTRIAANGFSPQGGGAHNTWSWSMQWFKGKLYVGTGREVTCVTVLANDRATGSNIYPFTSAAGQCPAAGDLPALLAAEIWRFTPATGQWQRVFQSPATIPIALDGDGNPTAFTARDAGLRGMAVVTEGGQEVLYVGGVTSGSIYDHLPQFAAGGYPPPRLLRTVDGTTWTPVPQTPGTFLGEIGNGTANSPYKFRSFRSLVSYKGRLHATVGDLLGVGVVISSANPSAGDDAWSQASPPYDVMPTWNLTVFNNYLYAATGLTQLQDPLVPGYGVYKTDGIGPWIPVVTQGGYQDQVDVRSPNGLSFAEFKGQLYVGMNRPTELIRINPDDTWEVIFGEPRNTPQGYKAPLSGLGIGFGSWFNGHFWRMASFAGHLYLGTWDWSVGAMGFDELDKPFGYHYGFDLLRSDDGVHWTAITQVGLGDPQDFGVRTLEVTPIGMFLGTTRPRGGFQVFWTAGPAPAGPVRAPTRLQAQSEQVSGRVVNLSWESIPRAVRYRVYRATVKPVTDLFPNVPPGPVPPDAFPLPYGLIGVTASPSFSENAPTVMQSIYFVRAEDAQGLLSPPSNLVGGPSKAASAAVVR